MGDQQQMGNHVLLPTILKKEKDSGISSAKYQTTRQYVMLHNGHDCDITSINYGSGVEYDVMLDRPGEKSIHLMYDLRTHTLSGDIVQHEEHDTKTFNIRSDQDKLRCGMYNKDRLGWMIIPEGNIFPDGTKSDIAMTPHPAVRLTFPDETCYAIDVGDDVVSQEITCKDKRYTRIYHHFHDSYTDIRTGGGNGERMYAIHYDSNASDVSSGYCLPVSQAILAPALSGFKYQKATI